MRALRTSSTSAMVTLAMGACLALAPLTAVRAQDSAPAKPPQNSTGQNSTGQNSPGEMAREGLEQMMRALSLLVESIPQYELPEILENGDIIIRRKQPDREVEQPEIDETAT
ncbi:MAG: hypothetical protein RH942_02570 [Kiloniellaceae bacterium]